MTFVLFLIYVAATSWLAWKSSRGQQGAGTFALGNGRMSPWIAGFTLGACLASSAMFVIFPGFVYADGAAALIGFSLPLIAGLLVGLVVLAPRFQRTGKSNGALTIAHWLGERYQSNGLRRLFGALSLLNIAYLTLITVGAGYVMSAALNVPYQPAVLFIIAFVFGYTALGGATAHAWTNTMQGMVMLGVAVLLFASGWQHWADGSAVQTLAQSGFTAADSKLFGSSFEVWLLPFFMGIALSTQPHLLVKALYVEGRAELSRTIAIGIGTFAVFSLVLFVGVYARVTLGTDIAQDKVVAEWLTQGFAWQALTPVVTVAILAASMSTLDGILVALSATISGDLFQGKASLSLNRFVLVGVALVTAWMALEPPSLVLILGQLGVYGLVAASAGPLAAGLLRQGQVSAPAAIASALVAVAVHFALNGAGIVENPGLGALAGLMLGGPIAFYAPVRASANSLARNTG